MDIRKKRLYIDGMSCISCQNKIEKRLKREKGVRTAEVSYAAKTADIAYDADEISLAGIKKIIVETGYEVLLRSDNHKFDFERMAGFLLVIFSLYALLQMTGILNLLVPGQLAETGMGYGMLFVIGLLTSVHCVAMCGGINLSQCLPDQGRKTEKKHMLRPAFLYNLGRVCSYTAVGFILGTVGMLIDGGGSTGLPVVFQGMLKIIAGVIMVIMGLRMLGIFPWHAKFHIRMPGIVYEKISAEKAKSGQPFVVGLLNGLMPCGPLMSMQIVALASGNPAAGALSMFAFSLGTVPLMMGLGSMVILLGRRFAGKVMSVGAVFVTVLGLAMLSQGVNLSGFSFFPVNQTVAEADRNGESENRGQSEGVQTGADVQSEEVQAEDGVQIVNSTLDFGRYPDITVKAGIPVKWTIDVPEGYVNGCNYEMLLREYGIAQSLTEGENVIEFTPDQAGIVQYTCWMGMICGTITVTD